MSLVKCQDCGDIIESTDQKACIRHAAHHGKNYKEICWELVMEERPGVCLDSKEEVNK